MPVVTNSNKKVILRDVANATYVIAGNTSVSNIAENSAVLGEENISGAYVAQIHWSTDGLITVSRGSNTLFKLTGSGTWNFRHMGMAMNENQTANLVISTATANSTVVIELVKQHANGYGSGYQLNE